MRFTRRSFVFVALICLVGVTQLWSQGPDAEGASISWWRYAVALYVLGLLYEAFAVRQFQVAVALDAPPSLRLGRQESVSVLIQNTHWRTLSLEAVANLPQSIETEQRVYRLHVSRGDTAQITLGVMGTEIGAYSWASLPARLRGPLGLAWWPSPLQLEASLQVVPDLLGQRYEVAANVSAGEEASRPGAGVELHHLRDYVPGDPLRAINWKATARSQRLISGVFSEEQHLEIMLVLDLGRTSAISVDGMTQFSHYINLASMFARYAATAGDSVGLLAVADRTLAALPPMRGTQAMAGINAALRTLAPAPVETDILAAAMQVQKMARNRCLIVFVTDLYSQTLEGDFGRSLGLWSRRHLPLVVGLIGDDVSEMVPRMAGNSGEAFESLAASEYIQAVKANASAARRLGAHAIVTRPAQLQAQVIAQYQVLKEQRRV